MELSRAELAQLDEFNARWGELRDTVERLIEIFGSLFVPWMTEVVQAIQSVYISLCRAQLYYDLLQKWWIPSWLAMCSSIWCPERWLPELRLTED